MKTVLSHCYNLAIAEKRTTVNLSKYIKLPKLEEKTPEPFTDDEVLKLWKSYQQDHFIGFILTMIYTGMMPGEVQKLKKDMLDFEKTRSSAAELKRRSGNIHLWCSQTSSRPSLRNCARKVIRASGMFAASTKIISMRDIMNASSLRVSGGSLRIRADTPPQPHCLEKY